MQIGIFKVYFFPRICEFYVFIYLFSFLDEFFFSLKVCVRKMQKEYALLTNKTNLQKYEDTFGPMLLLPVNISLL